MERTSFPSTDSAETGAPARERRGWLPGEPRRDRYARSIAELLHVLFVCSRNGWRSPTAEKVFAARADIEVRSRGLARSARRRLIDADVAWADLIFVMQDDHRQRLVQEHRDALGETPVHVLDIADEYRFMDPELVEILTAAVTPIMDTIVDR